MRARVRAYTIEWGKLDTIICVYVHARADESDAGAAFGPDTGNLNHVFSTEIRVSWKSSYLK